MGTKAVGGAVAVGVRSRDEMDARTSEEFVVRWVVAQRVVAGFLAAVVPDFHEAEDLLQEVAAAAVRKYPAYDPARPFAAWAIGIARNEVLNHRRKRATGKLVFGDDLVARVAERYERLSDDLDPVRDALRDCLRRVAGRSRVALDLRYAEGLKPAAVAERMNLSAGAARVLLARVRAAVRECVERRVGREDRLPWTTEPREA